MPQQNPLCDSRARAAWIAQLVAHGATIEVSGNSLRLTSGEAAAQAAALRAAAGAGAPFCEECEKAKQRVASDKAAPCRPGYAEEARVIVERVARDIKLGLPVSGADVKALEVYEDPTK